MRLSFRLCATAWGLTVSLALAQTPPEKPAFEVATVKPYEGDTSALLVAMKADGARVRYNNITLRDCIRAAYRVRDFQISGPSWIGDARFEITAKLPAGAHLDQIPEMLQALLAERFKLDLRHDTKEQSVYALTVAPGGPKLKTAQPVQVPEQALTTAVGPDGRPRAPMMFQLTPAGVHLFATAVTLASFVELMSRFTERPVVDLTGLSGQYSPDLTFAPETTRGAPGAMLPATQDATPSEPAPSLASAVAQLGLRIEARRMQMDSLVITHVERTPVEN